MNSPKNRWIKFAIWGTLYLLWVIWLGNYWWLFGLPVIFDLYITKKVHWAFWRRKNGKSNFILDWIDAIIFALAVAVFIRMFFYEAYVIPSSSMEMSAPMALTALMQDSVSSEMRGCFMYETPLEKADINRALMVWLFDDGIMILPLSFTEGIFIFPL